MKKLILGLSLLAIISFCISCKNRSGESTSDETSASGAFDETTAAPDPPAVKSELFELQSGKFLLNAVYTYVDDNEKHPTVLLIAGSGPCDCDETAGVHKPLADIAKGLANRGINSLRVDKRTKFYPTKFAVTDGISQEYLIDCRAAIEYIRALDNTGDIYLLGHSLGAKIAPILANEDDGIKGLILFNGSLRSTAEIACDQYIKIYPENKEAYIKERDSALNVNDKNANETYYFGASGYYWASLNKHNTFEELLSADVPLLIINSTNDRQIFESDIDLWKTSFDENEKTRIIIDDKISHLGYELDLSDQSTYLTKADFPERIISLFAEFILG